MTEPAQARIDTYRDALLALFPPGRALTRVLGRGITKLAEALAVEPARVHDRALALLEEADPSSATEVLPEWEALLGLPDACSSPTTVEGRRAAVVGRLVGTGGHSEADYRTLAITLGATVRSVVHFPPFAAGLSSAGDALTNDVWANHVEIDVEATPNLAVIACALRRQLRAHGSLALVDVTGALPGDLPMELA